MGYNQSTIIKKLSQFGLVNFGIVLIVGLLIANQVTNETWDGTHWGGDTGEDDYSTPTSNDGIDESSGDLCGSVIMFGIIYDLQYIVTFWKGKDE